MDDMKTYLAVLTILLYAFLFVFGSSVGSFLGVVIERVPKGEPFVRGRSHCPACSRQLRGWEMFPVFSYLLLGGKCRTCKARITPRCLLLEVLGGGFAMLSAVAFGLTWQALAAFALLCALTVVTFIDLGTMEIPNGVLLFMLIPAAVLAAITPETGILSHVIGFFCVSVPLLLITLAIPGAFGGGDIKLMAVCGLALGWRSTLVGFFIALLLGGAYGIWALSAKKLGRKEHFAFGPCLAFGAAASLFAGETILNWYLRLF